MEVPHEDPAGIRVDALTRGRGSAPSFSLASVRPDQDSGPTHVVPMPQSLHRLVNHHERRHNDVVVHASSPENGGPHGQHLTITIY